MGFDGGVFKKNPLDGWGHPHSPLEETLANMVHYHSPYYKVKLAIKTPWFVSGSVLKLDNTVIKEKTMFLAKLMISNCF